MAPIIKYGTFRAHSGGMLAFKVEGDNVDRQDIVAFARMIVGSGLKFGKVYGIPRGGKRLAEALEVYCLKGHSNTLIVDDVYTTGRSMEQARQELGGNCIGAVIYARAIPPPWIYPQWVLGSWIKQQP